MDEVRSRQEWSPCRRLDTRYGRCSESTCNSSARFGVKATAAQMALIKLELNPVALQWRHGRIKGCSRNVAVSRREQPRPSDRLQVIDQILLSGIPVTKSSLPIRPRKAQGQFITGQHLQAPVAYVALPPATSGGSRGLLRRSPSATRMPKTMALPPQRTSRRSKSCV